MLPPSGISSSGLGLMGMRRSVRSEGAACPQLGELGERSSRRLRYGAGLVRSPHTLLVRLSYPAAPESRPQILIPSKGRPQSQRTSVHPLLHPLRRHHPPLPPPFHSHLPASPVLQTPAPPAPPLGVDRRPRRSLRLEGDRRGRGGAGGRELGAEHSGGRLVCEARKGADMGEKRYGRRGHLGTGDGAGRGRGRGGIAGQR